MKTTTTAPIAKTIKAIVERYIYPQYLINGIVECCWSGNLLDDESLFTSRTTAFSDCVVDIDHIPQIEYLKPAIIQCLTNLGFQVKDAGDKLLLHLEEKPASSLMMCALFWN